MTLKLPSLRSASVRIRARRDMLWALGSLIEVGGWLCLGSDLGYFRPDEAAEILRPLLKQAPTQGVSTYERELIASNEWAVYLFSGDVDQAFGISLFADRPQDAKALQPAFQAAWIFATRFAADQPLNNFLQGLLLMDDHEWRQEVLGNVLMLDASPTWDVLRRLVTGHPLDGLVAALHHLQTLSAWVTSAASDTRKWRGADELRGIPIPQATSTAARLLVQSVGRLLRWRLDLSNERVNERLEATISVADKFLRNLMRSTGYDIKDAWPEGFRVAMLQAISDWNEMGGFAARKPTPDPKGGGGRGDETDDVEELDIVRPPAEDEYST